MVATRLWSSRNQKSNDQDNMASDSLEQTFGGYTVKQRLREEVESPFRTFRLFFFGASLASAIVAFYFSLLTLGKAYTGGFTDAPPIPEALQSVGINMAAIAICAGITLRDYQAKQADLARIRQGGALASLVVERVTSIADPVSENKEDGGSAVLPPSLLQTPRTTLLDCRRKFRILIAAGGPEYLQALCRSLTADQLTDRNTLPEAMAAADLLLVPVLLQPTSSSPSDFRVGDTSTCWMETQPVTENDRNLDVNRANAVVAFPRGPVAWADVLKPEIETAVGQGFDVSERGITLLLKKNGKILRRATGQPQWSGLLGTLQEVLDKNFGMPGDDEIYEQE